MLRRPTHAASPASASAASVSTIDSTLPNGQSRVSRNCCLITLPLSLPGVYAGSALVFIPAFGIFAIPDILGGPDDTLIGNLIKQQFLETRDWPFGSVLSIVLTAAALALAGAAAWIGRRGLGASGA